MPDINTYASMYKMEYNWPYPKALTLKPSKPPTETKPKGYYFTVDVEPYCHCDGNLYKPHLKRYEQLAEKEKQLHHELTKLNEQIATLSNEILDHPCDTDDDHLLSTYQISYQKRGMNITQYRKLMPAIESPVGVPVKAQTGMANPRKDYMPFTYSTFPRLTIDPCPKHMEYNEFREPTGRSEYQDTISKIGLMVITTRQQYTDPFPQPKRRKVVI